MRDLQPARGITVHAATVYRWVQKFGPEIRKRTYGGHRYWRGLAGGSPLRKDVTVEVVGAFEDGTLRELNADYFGVNW